MPGLNDPNDPAFTDPSQNGGWRWNAQKRSWEPTDPVVGALWNIPEAVGLKAQSIDAGSPGAGLNLGMAGDDRARMQQLLAQLGTQAQTGGGAWETALKQNTEANNNAATAIGQTLGGDAMSAGRAIGNARAGNEQRAVGQENLLRAQSQQTAQGQIADILSGQGALDAQSAAGDAAAKQGLVQANRSLESGAAKNRQNFVGSYAQLAMSHGGEVPGEPKVFGDDERNDTVPAWLSPNEIVIPISITSRPDAPEAAAKFVAAVQGRAKPGQTNFAPGGEVPTFGEGVDSGSPQLPTGGGVPNQSVRAVDPATIPQPQDPFASQTMEPSIGNGALLDTRPYASTREAALGNAQNFMTQYLGGGPSVAPQAMQNATDSTIADAFKSRGPGVVQGAAEQLQGAAGNAAGLVAGESQRGAASFAEALQKQRAQDIALATAQQQAAWRNTMMNAGIGLEQQAQLRQLLGSAGQGAVAMGGMFDVQDGPSHSGFSSDRSALETGHDRGPSSASGRAHDPEPSHDSASDHYAEGGVVAHLSRKGDPRRKRTFNDVGARKAEQGSPEEWKGFPEPKTQRKSGTQTEDDIHVGGYAEGGPVFDTSVGLPQPGPFAPAPPSSIPGALQVLASILRHPDSPEPLPKPRMMTPDEITAADAHNAPRIPEPPLRHSPDMTQRPFATPASRAPMPAAPQSAPTQGAPQKPPVAPPKADPYADQQKAAAMKAEAEAGLATEQAGILGDLQQSLQQNAIQQKETQTRAREEAEMGLAQIQQARDELKNLNTTVDPGRYWADRGVPGKISAIIGLALGAIGNDNGVNRSAQLLNQAIDRDIDAQKSSFELALRKGQSAVDSAQSIYALTRQMTQDDIAANLAAKGTALELAKNQVDIAAAKAGAPMAKANLAALSASIDLEKKKADEALRQRGFDNAIKKMGAETDRLRALKETNHPGAAAQQALLATVQTEESTIKQQGEKLKKLIEKYGTMELTGPAEAEMRQAVDNMAVAAAKLKDPNSAARPSEVEIEARNIFQPGFFKQQKTALQQIDSYLANSEQRRQNAFQARGVEAPQMGSGPATAGPAKKLMRLPSGEVVEVR